MELISQYRKRSWIALQFSSVYQVNIALNEHSSSKLAKGERRKRVEKEDEEDYIMDDKDKRRSLTAASSRTEFQPLPVIEYVYNPMRRDVMGS